MVKVLDYGLIGEYSNLVLDILWLCIVVSWIHFASPINENLSNVQEGQLGQKTFFLENEKKHNLFANLGVFLAIFWNKKLN